MRRAGLWVLLVSCAGGGSKNGDCGDICPEGTRRSSFDAVVRGQGVVVQGEYCETVCETINPCGPPNVPTIDGDGNYACDPLPGYLQIVPDVDVDFGWADGWVQP